MFNGDASGEPAAGGFVGVRGAVELKVDDLRIGATGALRPFVSAGNDVGAPPLKIERDNRLSFFFHLN